MTRKCKRLTETEREALLEDYASNEMTLSAIAHKYGISDFTVSNHAARAGLSRRHAHSAELREAVIDDCRNTSLTYSQIGARHGVHPESVSSWARAAGVVRAKAHDRISEETKAAIRAAYAERLTQVQIAEKVGVSATSVGKVLREAGLSKPPAPGESPSRLTEAMGSWVYGKDMVARWVPNDTEEGAA